MAVLNYVLDTNAVIYLQKGVLKDGLPDGRMAISVITEIELRGFPGLSGKQVVWLTRFFSSLPIIGLEDDIKETAIQLRRNHRIKVPDALVAATAFARSAILLTNDEYLHGIPGLSCRRLGLR